MRNRTAATRVLRKSRSPAIQYFPPSTFIVFLTFQRAEPTGCWSDEEDKRSFAIRRKPSTTSISTSTKR